MQFPNKLYYILQTVASSDPFLEVAFSLYKPRYAKENKNYLIVFNIN